MTASIVATPNGHRPNGSELASCSALKSKRPQSSLRKEISPSSLKEADKDNNNKAELETNLMNGQVDQQQLIKSFDTSSTADEPPPSDHDSLAQVETLNVRDSNRGDPRGCLFVASLVSSKSDAELTNSVTRHFERFGRLLHVKVLKDSMQRPYSFVQFENIADAERARAEAHDTLVDGRRIRVEPARVNRTLHVSRPSQYKKASDAKEETMTDNLVRKTFGAYGEIEDTYLYSGESLQDSMQELYDVGIFLKYRYRDDAVKAYMENRESSEWKVSWAANLEKDPNTGQIRTPVGGATAPLPPSAPPADRSAIFVGQLTSHLVTQAALEQRFGVYGEIESCHLVNKTLSAFPRCAFAFIRYKNEASASRAVELENGARWLDRPLRVQYREGHESRVARYLARGNASPPSNRIATPIPTRNRWEGYASNAAYPPAQAALSNQYAASFPWHFPPPMMPASTPLWNSQPRAAIYGAGGVVGADYTYPLINDPSVYGFVATGGTDPLTGAPLMQTPDGQTVVPFYPYPYCGSSTQYGGVYENMQHGQHTSQMWQQYHGVSAHPHSSGVWTNNSNYYPSSYNSGSQYPQQYATNPPYASKPAPSQPPVQYNNPQSTSYDEPLTSSKANQPATPKEEISEKCARVDSLKETSIIRCASAPPRPNTYDLA